MCDARESRTDIASSTGASFARFIDKISLGVRPHLTSFCATAKSLVLRFLNIAVDQFSWGGSKRFLDRDKQIVATNRLH